MYKLSPQFDELVARIFEADLQAVIVLIDGNTKGWRDRLLQRLCAALSDGTCASYSDHDAHERGLWFSGEENDRVEVALRVSCLIHKRFVRVTGGQTSTLLWPSFLLVHTPRCETVCP